jgi:hypothetical protein
MVSEKAVAVPRLSEAKAELGTMHQPLVEVDT